MLWKRDHASVTGRVCDFLADRQVSSYSRLKLFLPDECWLLRWVCDGSVMINDLCWLGWRLSHLVFLVIKNLNPSLWEKTTVYLLCYQDLFFKIRCQWQEVQPTHWFVSTFLISKRLCMISIDNIRHLRMNTNMEKYYNIPEISDHCW